MNGELAEQKAGKDRAKEADDQVAQEIARAWVILARSQPAMRPIKIQARTPRHAPWDRIATKNFFVVLIPMFLLAAHTFNTRP